MSGIQASPAVMSASDPARGSAEVTPRKHSYGQILKSSALIGGASVVNIGIGMIRTKAMAVMLGPAGFGLIGLYNSIADLARSAAGMGVNSSGVRQIAEAVGSGDTERIARTVVVLRRISIALGLLGAFLLIAFCIPVSVLTFGSREKAAAVALLSGAIFFSLISDGQGALIQGMRRIADMARMGVIGASCGTLTSILLVYYFRERGIVPSLIAVAGMSLLISWWFSRRVVIQKPIMTGQEVRHEAGALLKLGLAFMASGMLTMGAAYAVRIIVLRKVGFDAAGYYQSAWALGGLYVGMILQSMGADFYPRLTSVAQDNAECNRLVNEQALVSLLLAGPGILATLTFAPLVITLFYSAKFAAAAEILKWLCLGMTLRVVAWPMGFIVLAKGVQAIFFWTEVAATIVHVGLAWLLVHYLGLSGSGMAFFGLYVWHSLLIYLVVRRLSNFRWSAANRKVGLLFLPLIGLVFCCLELLPFWVGTSIGALASLLSGIYSLRLLCKLVPAERLPRLARRLLVMFRFVPARESNQA